MNKNFGNLQLIGELPQNSSVKYPIHSRANNYSLHFQKTYDRIDYTTKKIYKYVLDIKQDRRRAGKKSEELDSIKDELRKSLLGLKNQNFQVAVIAAMKAGKSTFLNATIGAEILPSESEACTVCPTDIKPIRADETPRLLEYREGNKQPSLVSQGESAKIRQDFLNRTHEIRQNNNRDRTIRFELWHPIAGISKYTSLAGFTLVDTPGPNEWESASFNSVKLKETALQALRTCDAILFILDYTSFQDDTNQILLKDLIEKRKDFLAENTGKIHFILNKVDLRSQKDRPIPEVIADLKQTLINFGLPQPTIYPVSAWKGLLSQLIINKKASQTHQRDFTRFFLGEYIGETFTVPKPSEIAPQALEDSGIINVQTEVIQNIIKNSAWDFLNEVTAKVNKQAQAIEDILNQEVWGWEIEFESLKQTVDEFKIHATTAREKVATVKDSVEHQKQILIEGFSEGIDLFAEEAKKKIQEEVDIIAYRRGAYIQARDSDENFQEFQDYNPEIIKKEDNNNTGISWSGIIERSGEGLLLKEGNLLKLVSGVGKLFDRAKTPLIEKLAEAIPDSFSSEKQDYSHANSSEENKEFDPYKFKVESQDEAKAIEETVNEFCAPLIKTWWVDTQDKLVREGTKIRESLADKIKKDIQEISNELSEYLEEVLQVELNFHEIEFPSFEFPGIDAKINKYQETIAVIKTRQEQRFDEGFCQKKSYLVDVAYESEEVKSVYEVDIRETIAEIQSTIDKQIPQTQAILERVIDKQISEDFAKAEKQINDYIKRSQIVLDRLLLDRQNKEIQADLVMAIFKLQSSRLELYLEDLKSIQSNLHLWKPLYCSNNFSK